MTSEIQKSGYFIDCMATQLQAGVATGMCIFNITQHNNIMSTYTCVCHIK